MDEQAKVNPGSAGKRDLLRCNANAVASDQKRCGDFTEIPTDEGKLYLA
jgi:hypothetical protein